MNLSSIIKSSLIFFTLLFTSSCQQRAKHIDANEAIEMPLNIKPSKANTSISYLYNQVEISSFMDDDKLIIDNYQKVQKLLSYMRSIWKKNTKHTLPVYVSADGEQILSTQTHMSYYSFTFLQKNIKGLCTLAYYDINESFVGSPRNSRAVYVLSGNGENFNDYILTKEDISQLKKITGYSFPHLDKL